MYQNSFQMSIIFDEISEKVHKISLKICVIFFRNLCNQRPPGLSLRIIVEPFSGFSPQLTGPDHLS
jgi:hypothetical protein